MAHPLRWGILAPGGIARQFADGLQALPHAQLVAVGSRDLGRAEKFAAKFAVPRAYGSYAQLAADPKVDAVYIASPHPLHMEHALLCVEAGKAVLCEKPFTLNFKQARQLVKATRKKKVFLMEAMWTRFLPLMAQVRQWVDDGAVGDVHLVSADFGFRAGFNPEGRLFNPLLGGGALLDVGVYTVSFAAMILGPDPVYTNGIAHLGTSGVDEQASVLLGYAGGAMANLSTSIRTNTPGEARIVGTEGNIAINAPFWKSTAATLKNGDGEQHVEHPLEGNGYNYQAAEVARCLAQGELESPLMPLDESLEIMKILDTLRAQWGLKYPMED
ncbi:MAG: gfo/Idh/MocA family oxidoreductase [Candidatus Latescibacteria bacterium]|nr:gfo/Idh/MocA family oxidoreductase [Candidatus Latescibacterota bacterium]